MKSHFVPQFIFRQSAGNIDLVAKNKNGQFGKVRVRKDAIEFLLGFRNSIVSSSVDNKYNGIHQREILSPHSTGLLVTTKIIRLEIDFANDKFLTRGVKRRNGLLQVLAFQHVHQCRFSCIIQTKENDLCGLVGQTKVIQNAPEPID
eukprot:TRINITY_DN2164_c0_g1_i1.p2 TRINITY_DN2164_c0_g1~~TRINITY_DN2164_c0_g1_i1.p2  ORF type:complete len:147 (-),score=3.67 TRINITY_DN2164_c0_g1_i1:126-566(-)